MRSIEIDSLLASSVDVVANRLYLQLIENYKVLYKSVQE